MNALDLNKIKINKKEKAIMLLTAVFESAGFVGALVVDPVWILTTDAGASAGMGFAMTAASAMIWITAMSAAMVLVWSVISYLLWKSYSKKANKLIAEITEKYQQNLKIEETISQHFIALLRTCFALKAENSAGLLAFESACERQFSADFYEKFLRYTRAFSAKNDGKIDEIFSKSDAEITAAMPHTDSASKTFYDAFRVSMTSPPSPPTKASYRPMLRMGAIMFFVTYAAMFSSGWGATAVLLGGITMGAMIATPFIGWGILASALVLASLVGGAWAYYTHKNEKRKTLRAQLSAEHQALELHAKATNVKVSVVQEVVAQVRQPHTPAVRNDETAIWKHERAASRSSVGSMGKFARSLSMSAEVPEIAVQSAGRNGKHERRLSLS